MQNLSIAQNILLTGEFAFLFRQTNQPEKTSTIVCVGNLEFYGFKTIDRLLTIESTQKKVLSLSNFKTAFIFKDNSKLLVETTINMKHIKLANNSTTNIRQTLLYIAN